MHDPSGDLRRLFEALEREWQLTGLGCDFDVLGELQAALRKGEWKVTVAVHGESQVIALWPGFHDKAFGMAVDVGSTTVAAHLCDLETGELVAAAGTMNPQIRFGEDLMSRVSYAMMNPGGAATDDRRRSATRSGALAAELAREAGIATHRHPRAHARRQPDHASPRARHRPGGARRRAVRARRRPGADAAGLRRSASPCTRTRASTCCPASPATSAPTPPA